MTFHLVGTPIMLQALLAFIQEQATSLTTAMDVSAWKALVLGLVEGITEFIPISSTGHLVLAESMLGLDKPPELKHATDTFIIVIQGGAILAVLGLYWPTIVRMTKGLLGHDRDGLRLFLNICIAFLPAAAVGLVVHGWIDKYLMDDLPVIIFLFLGGLLMVFVGRGSVFQRTDGPDSLSALRPRHALAIGLFQCLAMLPGMSRSMVTIVGGMFVGLSPARSAEFSFLLGLPTLVAACLYRLVVDSNDNGHMDMTDMFEHMGALPVILGFITATLTSAIAIKWLVAYLKRHGLAAFGWYRIGFALLMALVLLT